MKKIVLYGLLLFLTAGCDVSYNLTVKNDVFIEETNISYTDPNSEEYIYESTLNDVFKINSDRLFPMYYAAEGNDIGQDNLENSTNDSSYDSSYDETKLYNINYDDKIFSIKGKFNINNYYKSNIIRQCAYMRVTKTDDLISYSIENINDCFKYHELLKNLTVNLTIDKEVMYNNADSVSNNVYTWSFNNTSTNNIVFYYKQPSNLSDDIFDKEYDKKTENNEEQSYEGLNEKQNNIIVVIVVISFFVSLVIILYFKTKMKKRS